MNVNTRTLMAVLFAALMVTTPVAGAGAVGASERVSPVTDDAVTWTGYDVPSETIRHSVAGTPRPGVFVTVDTREDMTTLEQWANASAERRVVQRFNASNTTLLALPMSDVKHPVASVERWTPGGESTVSELGYVSAVDLNVRVQNVEPIKHLSEVDDSVKPPGSWAAEASTGANYDASDMAWSKDTSESDLTAVDSAVGADTMAGTGQGVNIAVIDSGVNFGNGSLYGSGVSGSDMRVGDAHDYVDGESVNLSVSRSQLETELDKMEDPNGHGSWVSSSALNARNGIAPNATLHAYRALNSEGQGSTADIKSAIARSDRTGADIIVMSLGSTTYSDAMATELRRVLSEDGNVTAAFVAVGNSYPQRVSSPADVDAVLGVQATNTANASTVKKAYFGNAGPDNGLDGSGEGQQNTRGATPDIAAPGMNISAPVFTGPDKLSTTNRTLSGTSMAAPIAAGVGALVLEADPGLKGDASAFHDRMVNSGSHTPNIGVTESAGGMVNASRAINGYDGADAPDRDLPDDTSGRDAANQFLAGGTGLKLAKISEFGGGLAA